MHVNVPSAVREPVGLVKRIKLTVVHFMAQCLCAE